MEQIFKSLEDIFQHAKDNSVELTHIQNEIQLTNVIGIFGATDEKTFSITTKDFSIIILDNRVFNETYLLDKLLLELCKTDLKSKVKLYYIDCPMLRSFIGKSDIIPSMDSVTVEKFERTILHPSILVLNTIDNDIYIIEEPKLSKISDETIIGLITNLTEELKDF